MFEGYQRTFVTARLSIPDLGAARAAKKSGDKKAADALALLPEVDSPDLTFVKFILASEHENDNGDYFQRHELVAARATPRHKPFNVEHMVEEKGSYISKPLYNQTQNTIIGHMVDTALAFKDGTILDEKAIAKLDKTDNPSRPQEECLDLVASAVLYGFYFPDTVSDIKTMAGKGDISVSMECWFKGYDFVVDNELVKATAENKKQLHEDWNKRKVVGCRRVCRALNSILFGGGAATEKPANSDSVFLAAGIRRNLDELNRRHAELHVLYSARPTKQLADEHLEITRTAASLSKRLVELGTGA